MTRRLLAQPHSHGRGHLVKLAMQVLSVYKNMDLMEDCNGVARLFRQTALLTYLTALSSQPSLIMSMMVLKLFERPIRWVAMSSIFRRKKTTHFNVRWTISGKLTIICGEIGDNEEVSTATSWVRFDEPSNLHVAALSLFAIRCGQDHPVSARASSWLWLLKSTAIFRLRIGVFSD